MSKINDALCSVINSHLRHKREQGIRLMAHLGDKGAQEAVRKHEVASAEAESRHRLAADIHRLNNDI